MGDFNVKGVASKKEMRAFSEHLINDVKALEQMLYENWFDIDVMRIGAEQELCLVDKHFRPAPAALAILEEINDPDFVTEIAKFNLEVNLQPLLFEGNCLSDLEKDLDQQLDKLIAITDKHQLHVALAGILPTIRKFDLDIENMIPFERYKALLRAIEKLRGKQYEIKINGIDELNIKLDSAFIEGCNTGFQVHLQTRPDDFVNKYNISQAVAAPVLAAAANSPFLFGKRLWKESRIALFQQSIDTRKSSDHLRQRSPRVTFGNQWLKGSILEIYREDIMRFRVLIHSAIEENSLESVRNKKIPKLKALTTHNSTVYRWNRPCYGFQGEKPHLRIENRLLPAGPTTTDEIANTALWLGLMNGLDLEYSDITEVMDFDDTRANFLAAARNGLDTKFNWVGKKKYTATDLIHHELLPIAKAGLQKADVSDKDINHYLDIILERVESGRSGAQWMLHSYSRLSEKAGKEEALTAITAAMVKKQKLKQPLHKWALADVHDLQDWQPTNLLVEEFMDTDLFTVQKDDLIETVAEMMDWRNFRNVPVEDNQGKLVGLITQRMILRYFLKPNKKKNTTVKDIMLREPICIEPEATVLEATQMMERNSVSSLPVLKNNKLVGIITDTNFLQISRSLFKRLNKGK